MLHGMLRVRGFTQDDVAHLLPPEQLKSEVNGVLDLTDFMMQHLRLHATRPTSPPARNKSLGTDEEWAFATEALRAGAARSGACPTRSTRAAASSTRPRSTSRSIDALGREWQGPTMPGRLQPAEALRRHLHRRGRQGAPRRSWSTARCSARMERFIGGLIEHYGGDFPVWLAPVQVVVIPIADRHARVRPSRCAARCAARACA